MAASDVLVPEPLQRQIVAFVLAEPDRHKAFCALVGAAVGSCVADLSRRELAEALWRLGDYTIEQAGP